MPGASGMPICLDFWINCNSPYTAINTPTPRKGIASAGIAAILLAATRLVLLAKRVPNLLVAALRLMAEVCCFLMVASWEAILEWCILDTVRTPVAVARAPDKAALKAMLESVSTYLASRPRMVQVSSRRFVKVIMTDCFPFSSSMK